MSIFIEIFDSLISKSTPYNLDEKLSDQSKGPRWLRGPRDNIFSISAIINSDSTLWHCQMFWQNMATFHK